MLFTVTRNFLPCRSDLSCSCLPSEMTLEHRKDAIDTHVNSISSTSAGPKLHSPRSGGSSFTKSASSSNSSSDTVSATSLAEEEDSDADEETTPEYLESLLEKAYRNVRERKGPTRPIEEDMIHLGGDIADTWVSCSSMLGILVHLIARLVTVFYLLLTPGNYLHNILLRGQVPVPHP
jgi:hypothetical protein